MGTQIEKTKHHIVPDSQKSTRYVKNGLSEKVNSARKLKFHTED